MRKVQIIIIVLLMFLGIVATGEFYISYVYNFEDMATAKFYTNGYSKEEFLDEIYDKAAEHKVNICAISTITDSTYSTKKEIYCDDSFKQYLETSHYIYGGKHSGFLSGDVLIEYYNFKDIPYDKLDGGIDTVKYYLVGKLDDMNTFKDEVVDKYGGTYPVLDEYDALADSKEKVTTIWVILGLIIVILSYYTIQVNKKETVIKLTLGENINSLILKNITIEVVEIFGTFFLVKLLLSRFEYTGLLLDRILIILSIVSCVCALIQISARFFNISLVMSNAKISKEIIIMNYVVKLISTILVMVLMAEEFAGIIDYFNFSKQKEFFENYKEYQYVSLQIDGDNSDKIEVLEMLSVYEEEMYRENIDNAGIVYFCDDYYGEDKAVISANKNSLPYISEKIQELDLTSLEDKIYVIYNKNTEITNNLKNEIDVVSTLQCDKDEEIEIEYLQYSNDISMSYVCMNNNDKSDRSKNPIIVFNNRSTCSKLSLEEEENSYQIFFDEAFWKATDKEIQNMLNSINNTEGYSIKTSGVYETYMDKLQLYKRTAFLKFILIVMVLVIQIVVSKLLVKMCYDANAVEIAVKKVLGHNILLRYKTIYIISAIFALISTTITVITSYEYNEITNTSNKLSIVTTFIIIIMLDIFIITRFIVKHEKINVQKTLKGGCL